MFTKFNTKKLFKFYEIKLKLLENKIKIKASQIETLVMLKMMLFISHPHTHVQQQTDNKMLNNKKIKNCLARFDLFYFVICSLKIIIHKLSTSFPLNTQNTHI